MSPKQEEQKQEATWLRLIKENPAVATGIFGVGAAVATGIFGLVATVTTSMFSTSEKNAASRQALELEQLKFEYELIAEIIPKILLEDDKRKEDAAESLLLLVDIRVVKILDAEALRKRADEGNLPSLPALRSSSSLSENHPLTGACRKIVPVNGSVAVYDNSDLDTQAANRIGTIDVGTPMYIAGVIRYGSENPTAVQVLVPNGGFVRNNVPDDNIVRNIGWVDGSRITECEE